MLMKLLFGSDPGALTVHCLSELAALTIEFPDQRAFLIVPEQIKVQMERAYLETTQTAGLMMAEVLSFRRLAHRLLDETGLLPQQRIDAFGRRMLLFRVLKENRAQMHSFGHLADRSGFLTEIDAVVGDLKRHSITAAQLRQAAAADCDTEKSLSNKLNDLAILLTGYNDALLSHGLADSDDDLERLALLLEKIISFTDPAALPFPYNRLKYLRHSHVFLSGFGFTRDFTPQEYRILNALKQLGVSLNIAVQADAMPTSEQAVEAGPEAFLIGRRTLYHLEQRFSDCQSVLIEPGQRTPNLKVIDLADREAEIDYVAGEIRRLVQTDGYRYKDIAIALCEPHTQLALLRAAAQRYNLALFLDETRSLAGTSLLRYFLGLLDLPLRNWARDPLMTVLRSGLTSLEPTEVDLLENDLLERGLFRRDRLFSRHTLAEPQPDDEAARRIKNAVETVFEPMRVFTDKLKRSGTTAECCQLIRKFCSEQGLAAKVESVAEQLRAKGEADAALLLASAHSMLGEVLGQLETIGGNLPISLADLRDTLRSGLSNASVTLIPSALDQIIVGEWRRINRLPCRVVFVIGAVQDHFPAKGAPEGLLKDLDRRFLSEQLSVSLPSIARDQVFADAAHLHQLLTRPSERLYLGVSGGEPAETVRRLTATTPDYSLIKEKSMPDFSDPRLNSRAAARHQLLLLNGMIHKSMTAAEAAAWRTLANSLAVGDAELTIPFTENLLLPTIDTEILTGIYSETPSLSVSQLEKYAACPFSHLAAYILKLRERAEYSPQATDTGTILHGVVELALSDLTARLANAGNEPGEINEVIENFRTQDLRQLTEHLIAEVVEREEMDKLNDAGIRADVGRRLSRLSSASLEAILAQLQPEDFLPSELEWIFGPNQQDRFSIVLDDGRELQLRGIIDRIDVREQEGRAEFRIIDYKSGDARVDFDKLYHGLALQLPTYLAAYAASHPEMLAADAGYFRFDRPMLSEDTALHEPEIIEKKLTQKHKLRNAGLDQTELQLMLKHTEKRLAELAQRLFAGCFQVAPRRLMIRNAVAACKYCGYSAVCGFDRHSYCYLPSISQIAGPEGDRLKKKVFCRLLTAEAEAANESQSNSEAIGRSDNDGNFNT